MNFIYLFSLLIFTSCGHIPLLPGGDETVIVVHGFARRAGSMEKLAEHIHQAGYEVRNIEYSSIQKSLDEVQSDVFEKFDQYIFSNPGRKIHFVGHSLGGLLVRAYLDRKSLKNLGSVVLMGVPNKGSALVNEYEERWYFSWLGPVLSELRVDDSQFLKKLKAPYYKVGVIAGSKPYSRFSDSSLEGAHDGMVSVESAQLEGMSDFILIDVNHSRMKRDHRVIDQVVYFLKHARFKK